MRHLRSLLDLSPAETAGLIESAVELKEEWKSGKDQRLDRGRVLGLLFEKPSLRTRVSFESCMVHLGGGSIFLNAQEVGLGSREPVEDFARVVSTYVDVLAVRCFSHALIEKLAEHATVPVVNALSDAYHPCQAMGDAVTIREQFGKLSGLRVAFVGDANNVSRSLALLASYVGIHMVLSSPAGYRFDEAFLELCSDRSAGGRVTQEKDPRKAVADADVVYTDVWASMGQEEEREERRKAFAAYQVNDELMSLAKPTARFLHCLPAHRDEEVTASVIDGPQSLVVAQASNRLHAQKALLLRLLGQG